MLPLLREHHCGVACSTTPFQSSNTIFFQRLSQASHMFDLPPSSRLLNPSPERQVVLILRDVLTPASAACRARPRFPSLDSRPATRRPLSARASPRGAVSAAWGRAKPGGPSSSLSGASRGGKGARACKARSRATRRLGMSRGSPAMWPARGGQRGRHACCANWTEETHEARGRSGGPLAAAKGSRELLAVRPARAQVCSTPRRAFFRALLGRSLLNVNQDAERFGDFFLQR